MLFSFIKALGDMAGLEKMLEIIAKKKKNPKLANQIVNTNIK